MNPVRHIRRLGAVLAGILTAAAGALLALAAASPALAMTAGNPVPDPGTGVPEPWPGANLSAAQVPPVMHTVTRTVVVGGMPGRCSLLYQGKKTWQWARACWIEANRAGKSGRYFMVLNCDSEYGLSLLTCGRECDWVMPRSASKNATGLEVIEEPRSAWMASWPRLICCLWQVSLISFSARAADSAVATIQPVTYRLKMPRITYR